MAVNWPSGICRACIFKLLEIMELQDFLDIPGHLKCPISRRIMKKPMKAPDGITYDEKHLNNWLLAQKRSPVTSTMFPVDGKGRVELEYSESIHAAIKEHCIQKVILISSASFSELTDRMLDTTMECLCELLEYLKPSSHRDLYRNLLDSLALEPRAAFCFFSSYSRSRTLNKLKVLRSLTSNPTTSRVFNEFLAIEYNKRGDFEAALRELNLLDCPLSPPLEELRVDLIFNLWRDLEDLTQFPKATVRSLLEKAIEKQRLSMEAECAFYLFLLAESFSESWEYLALLIECREFKPEVKEYMIRHVAELLDLEVDAPKELLCYLLLEERNYEAIAGYYEKLQPAQTLAALADPLEIEYIMKLPDFPPAFILDMKAAKATALLKRGKLEQGYDEFWAIAESCV